MSGDERLNRAPPGAVTDTRQCPPSSPPTRSRDTGRRRAVQQSLMDENPELDDATAPANGTPREPGWYREASHPVGHRYWDGRAWRDGA